MCHMSMPYLSLASFTLCHTNLYDIQIKTSSQHKTAHMEKVCRMYVILDQTIIKLSEFRLVQY